MKLQVKPQAELVPTLLIEANSKTISSSAILLLTVWKESVKQSGSRPGWAPHELPFSG